MWEVDLSQMGRKRQREQRERGGEKIEGEMHSHQLLVRGGAIMGCKQGLREKS